MASYNLLGKVEMRIIALTEEEAGSLLAILQRQIEEQVQEGHERIAFMFSEIRHKLKDAPRETAKEVYARLGYV